jgi:hypothetical protein
MVNVGKDASTVCKTLDCRLGSPARTNPSRLQPEPAAKTSKRKKEDGEESLVGNEGAKATPLVVAELAERRDREGEPHVA